jgi:membrane-bound ClpP family serine protease
MAQPRSIEGMAEAFEQFRKAGLRSAAALLEAGATDEGRKDLASRTGVSDELVLQCIEAADLRRIRGITEQHAELLELAGVRSVPVLAHRNAAHLQAALIEANQRRSLVRDIPSERMLAHWIEDAKALPHVVVH